MTAETQEKSEVYRFGDCVLDAARRELRVAGNVVTMQPKAFELLLFLVRNRHRAIDKDELQDTLWPRSIVTETALTRCVMKARRAVEDDADRQSVIKTVHGHGYRFIAIIEDDAPESVHEEILPTTPVKRTRKISNLPIAAGLIVVIAALWWYLSPPAVSGAVRLAVLPVENATGDAELDWTRTGLMALMNRMLEDQGVAIVSGNSVSDLAGETPLRELMDAGSDFQQTLRQTTAATHFVGATLESDGGLYRLTYTFTGGEKRPEQRTVVGQEPAGLIRDVVATVTTFATQGPPELERMSFVSNDNFLNEAYARAMSLQFEGRYEEAQRLFQVIIEQQPELFWPRYEYALAARNLRDFETAERLFIELRRETQAAGERQQEAAVMNSLGIMYMGRRRNEDALELLTAVAQIGEDMQNTHYQAVANINLGLLAKNNGDLPLSLDHLQKAATIYEQADIQSLPGALHNNLSGVLILLGRLDEAEQHSLAAIENFRLTGKRLFESYALSRLSSIHRRNGLLDEAEKAAEAAMAVRVELGDRRGTAASLLTMSDIMLDRGDLTRAHQYAMQARDIGNEIDDQDVTVDALLTIAKTELALSRPHDAAADFAAAEAIASNHGDRMNAFAARYGIARSWIAIGDYDGAAVIADELLAEARASNHARNETAGLVLQADIHMAQQEWTASIEPLEQVLQIAQSVGDNQIAARVHNKMATAWLELDDIGKASTHIDLLIAARPMDWDVLKLRARLAAESGDPATAVELMSEARTRAGESWSSDDEHQLTTYRETAE
jgi:DNA-binding winged helix-turn-helix (wHTH) protein/tetratricopeptide (TPR) repeat protein